MKKIVSVLLLIVVLLNLSIVQINAAYTTINDGYTVANYARAAVGTHKMSRKGLCQTFAWECLYDTLGVSNKAGCGCCATKAWQSYGVSSSRDDIPLGAAVYFGGSSTRDSVCGQEAGHVGIYIGNNEIAHAWSSTTICKTTIDYVINCGYYYRGWGWQGGYALATEGPSDTEQPTISSLKVSNVSGDSFTINCEVYDNVGVTSAYIIPYGPGGNSGNGFTIPVSNNFNYTINTSDYGGEGLYSVHVYVYDSAGNGASAALSDIQAISDSEAPVMSKIYASNISSNSFTINCEVYDNIAVTKAYIIVYGPGGNSGNGFSIDVFNNFSYTINTSDYGGRGLYSVHVYIYDNKGNSACAALNDINAVSDDEKPVICAVRPSGVSSKAFTINCDVYDNIAVTRAYLIVYGPGGNSGNGFSIDVFNNFSYTINTSDYGGAGWYSVHIYIFDGDGNQTGGGIENLYIADDTTKPEINDLTASNISDSSFTINCSTNEKVVRAWLNIYGPNYSDGYAITMYGTNFTHTIDTSKYGGAGSYEVHVYVWDVAGNESGGRSTGRFIANKRYTVNFNANLGMTPLSSMIVTNSSTYGTLPTPTRVGYTFNGWYTASSGGTQIVRSSTVCLSSAQTLYAHWTPNNYVAYLNANGGNVDKESINITYDSTYSSLPTPTRKGYYFNGWYTAQNGGSLVTNDTKVSSTDNQTLYAQWEELTPFVVSIVHANGNTFKITPTTYNIVGESTVIVAGYKGKQLVDVSYDNQQPSYTLTGDIDTIKVMVWNNLSGLMPLCEAEVISSSEFIIE